MTSPTTEPVSFEALAGWSVDAAEDALAAFAKSLDALNGHESDRPGYGDLKEHCAAAAALIAAGPVSRDEARAFFEQRFVPHAVKHDEPQGLLTGYYEPVLAGSRTKSDAFPIPLLRRPPDLVNLIDDSLRAVAGATFTHARQTPDGVVPYPTRREIELGALDDLDLPFVYLADPVDTFFLHVQGSGLIALDDGSEVRVGYDGKNGHPYTSVGKYVISLGELSPEEATLEGLKAWLQADEARGQAALWQNESFIFFRELGPASETSTLGARGIPLTSDRSLAADAGCHELGLPVFVVSPTLTHAGDADGFRRLMVAQDVGSAIRGPERGDIFFGVGERAGHLAGITKHPGNFFVLLPRPVAETP